jgi:hypothetical protein
MTPGKIVFLINIALAIVAVYFTNKSDNASGENSMSAELPALIVLAWMAVIDIAFALYKVTHWLFN